MVRNAPKWYETHQNMSLGSNGVDRVLLQKIPMRLRGINFCTSSARFALSFVRQTNSSECTQMIRNAPKCQFRVKWGGSGAFVAKNFDTTLWHELLHLFGPFCTEFRKATKRSSMLPNRTKYTKTSVYGPMGWIGSFVAKNSDATSCTNFCTSSTRFAPSFVRQPNGPKHTQMVRNAPKRQFKVKCGGSGAFIAKNSDVTSWHELLHYLAYFALSFVRQPNGPECTQIVRNALKHQFNVQ